jgi:ribonuclease HI
MELMAAAEGLKRSPEGARIVIYTDSSYLINGITKWVKGWKRNGWLTKTRQDVVNRDVWEMLDGATAARAVEWRHIGGHVGILGNERCDHIATSFADGEDAKLYDGPLSAYDLPNVLDVSRDELKAGAKRSSSSHSRATAFSYVSAVGGVVEVHHSWAECEKRVKGAKGARYKKSVSGENEAAIIQEFSTI